MLSFEENMSVDFTNRYAELRRKLSIDIRNVMLSLEENLSVDFTNRL